MRKLISVMQNLLCALGEHRESLARTDEGVAIIECTLCGKELLRSTPMWGNVIEDMYNHRREVEEQVQAPLRASNREHLDH